MWLVVVIVAVLGLAVLPAHGWDLDLAHFHGVRSGMAHTAAAIVDIDTSLKRANEVGAGTGIVVDPGGMVLTNNHVIEGAAAISATDVGNRRTYAAIVLGRDRAHDVALLQLRGATQLATAALGDSSQLAVGDRVVGLGNAGGKGGRPSRAPGVVTALNQTVSASDDLTGRAEQLTGMIEIAAAIRPGDSGGPLVDSFGHVIGIDTAGTSGYRVEGRRSQGYAIPINTALQIVEPWRHRQAGLGR